ncbi:hypothetical protein DdX_11956 [Ditylenchus destructor]|uniref:Uncharacterized protein n=1 Tax=Ditylenchus destructor TaxID=166010 RepID=A0AAD4R3X2_9BILA|nr:hypothetical protein DdX_11956 [Ditylenchus destructor]
MSMRGRPRLNVHSDYLIFFPFVNDELEWKYFKDMINKNRRLGDVLFVESFEAWNGYKNGSFVLEFGSSGAIRRFEEQMDQIFDNDLEYKVMKKGQRQRFFDRIQDETGVDLLKCKGIPPSFAGRSGYDSSRLKRLSGNYRSRRSSSPRRSPSTRQK